MSVRAGWAVPQHGLALGTAVAEIGLGGLGEWRTRGGTLPRKEARALTGQGNGSAKLRSSRAALCNAQMARSRDDRQQEEDRHLA